MRRLDAIWKYSGSTFTDVTQSLGDGTASISLAAGDKLYLGYRDWMAGVLTFISTAPDGSPDIRPETYDGNTNEWKQLPVQERYDQLAIGAAIDPLGYDFTETGLCKWGPSPWLWTLKRSTQGFPEAGAPPTSDIDLYWVRLRNAGSVTVTIDRLLPNPYNTYCSHNEVARFMGLPDFDDLGDPSATFVRERIRAAEDWFDGYTHRSFRIDEVFRENHNFNPYGIRLRKRPVLTVVSVGLWQGNQVFSMTEGRNREWFVTPETGMLSFTLPSFRLRYYSFLLSRYIRQNDSVVIKYLSGADFDTDPERMRVQNIILMRVGADLIRQLDWTAILTNNPDAIPKPEKAKMWDEAVVTQADEMRALVLA